MDILHVLKHSYCLVHCRYKGIMFKKIKDIHHAVSLNWLQKNRSATTCASLIYLLICQASEHFNMQKDETRYKVTQAPDRNFHK